MKPITVVLVCLLLGGLWLQEVDSKSSECDCGHFVCSRGGQRGKQVLWGWGPGSF